MVTLFVVACLNYYKCGFETINLKSMDQCNKIGAIIAGMDISKLEDNYPVVYSEFLFECDDGKTKIAFASSDKLEKWYIRYLAETTKTP